MKPRLCRSNVVCLVLTVALTSVSCHSKTGPDGTLTTYTISGVVRASADQSPIEAAAVQASGTGSNGVWTARTVISDAAGHYEITGLRDAVTVSSTKAGFFTASAGLQLTQDAVVNLSMMKGGPEGGDLVVNKTLSGAIDAGDEKCDPNWDRNSPCRTFSFLPETPRVYQFVLAFDCNKELELHVFNAGTRLFNISSQASPITKDVALGAGTYQVRLMAYYDCRRFDLTVK